MINIIKKIIIICMLLFYLLSCSKHKEVLKKPEEKLTELLTYSNFLKKDKISFFLEDDLDVLMTFSFDLFYITKPQETEKLIKDIIYDSLSVEKYADNIIDKNLPGDAANKIINPKTMPNKYSSWEYGEETAVKAVSANIIVIQQDQWEYTGGAHGNSNTKYFVIDLVNKKRIFIDDIIKNQASPSFSMLIENSIRDQFEIKSDVPLSEIGFFEDSIKLSEDFFINAEGIGFQWDKYEIAPYSMGQIEIIIPYALINDFLTDKGKQIISNFLK